MLDSDAVLRLRSLGRGLSLSSDARAVRFHVYNLPVYLSIQSLQSCLIAEEDHEPGK